MFATGKFLKDKAANARRSATTLRHLAEDIDVGIADKGVLLTAAAIVEAIAIRTAKLGKEHKNSEEKYRREHAAAMTAAEKLISTLPQACPLDKVAMVSCIRHRVPYLEGELVKRATPKEVTWSLNYWNNDTRREIAHDIASSSISKKLPVDVLFEAVRQRFEAMRGESFVITLAERFQKAESSQQVAV